MVQDEETGPCPVVSLPCLHQDPPVAALQPTVTGTYTVRTFQRSGLPVNLCKSMALRSCNSCDGQIVEHRGGPHCQNGRAPYRYGGVGDIGAHLDVVVTRDLSSLGPESSPPICSPTGGPKNDPSAEEW